MDYICVFLSNYTIISCIFYPIEQIMDALLLDLIPLSEKKVYIINTTALAIINKFTIRHEYGVTEQQNKPDKYGILRKY